MKKSLLLLLFSLFTVIGICQQHVVTGLVTDETKEPIVGASVVIKGTTQGTITDINGAFSLNVTNPNVTLEFSFIGMKKQEIHLEGRSKLDVILISDMSDIEEVVVVGYGTQKKESVVGAISQISSADIVRSPAANLSVSLAGKMPGLSIMQTSGELGAENIDMYIRGQASMNSTDPLILVDGVERSITNIDPYDIESISILKDASATAVYGVRGANGVILVTTKQGVIGKPKVSANVNYSMQKLTRIPEPLNAIDYMNVRNEVVKLDNPDNPLPYSEEEINHYRNGDFPEYYRDRNWYEEFTNKYTPMFKSNVNMSGGTEKTKYFASLGYTRQGGPFKTEHWDEYGYDNEQRLDRFTYRANIDMKLTPSLRGWMNLSGSLQDKNDPIIRGDQASAATTASWYYVLLAGLSDRPSILKGPNVDPDGNVVDGIYGQLNRTGYRVTTKNDIQSTIGFEQDLKAITKGLKAKAVVSYDTKVTHIRGFRRTYSTYKAEMLTDINGQDSTVVYNELGSGDSELIPVLTQTNSTRFNLDASLNYNRKFGDHDVSALFLYNQTKRIVNAEVPYNYVGIVGRATYGYKQRYLGEFNFGMNGSEQFAKGRRFGFFPSLSLGWVLSEENFLKNSSVISFLKIRGSYGEVGNDRMGGGRFVYLDNWTQGSKDYFQGLGNYAGLPAPVYEKTMPNTLVTWEVAKKSNVGIEANFNNGIEFDLDVFYEKRSSILMSQVPIPVYMFGQKALPSRNDGVMSNRGFEAGLAYKKKLNKDLYVSTGFQFAYARNEVENANEVSLGDDFAYPYRIEGFPRGSVYGYDCLGYFKDEAEIAGWADQSTLGGEVLPGDLKYKDQNDDGIIDEKDKVRMKHPRVPEINMSYTLRVKYKGFDFSALIQGVTNYTFDFSGRAIWDWNGNNYDGLKNYFGLHKYAWTPEKAENGGDIRYPRMHVDGATVSKQPSDYWLIDLWYMRLKNVELGYTLPKKMLKSIGLGDVRVYVNGLNLITIDNMPFKYLDPEVSSSLSHPLYANYNAGINITF